MSSNLGLAKLAVVCGLIVFALKLIAYFISGSVALLSDALESIANIAASAVMLLSIYVSLKPADISHNYGHQKIEGISCFIEGALITIAGLTIAWAALGRLLEPVSLGTINLALIISLTATLLNGVLSYFLSTRAKKTGSLALEGDSKHLLSDVLSSLGVIVGLYLAQTFGLPVLDPILALLVSGLVLKMGIDLLSKSGDSLMDQSCLEEEEKVRSILDFHRSQFIDFHSLKTRRSGNITHAELHLSVDPSISVKEAHELTDHLQDDLNNELPDLVLSIHVEPPRASHH